MAPTARVDSLVRAATELACFGRAWVAVGVVQLAGAAALAALAGLSGPGAVAIALVLGLSTGGVLAGLLVGRRTGPAILYARILDQAPDAPAELPREHTRATALRTLAPALLVAVVLAAVGPLGVAGVLVLAGERQDDVLSQLPVAALAVGGGWTLVCGLAGLRLAHYFARWERRRGKAVLCRPLSAGLMRKVYCVSVAGERATAAPPPTAPPAGPAAAPPRGPTGAR